jgi:hypothetical protein
MLFHAKSRRLGLGVEVERLLDNFSLLDRLLTLRSVTRSRRSRRVFRDFDLH